MTKKPVPPDFYIISINPTIIRFRDGETGYVNEEQLIRLKAKYKWEMLNER